MEPVARLKVVSLFSGAGGLGLGFAAAGKFDIVLANDIKEYMARVYSLNFRLPLTTKLNPPSVPSIVLGDVASLSFDGIEADVVIGGPPCQDFSVLRASTAERGGVIVRRGRLYAHFVRALAAIQPKAFLFENVPGLMSANGGLAYRVILEDLSNLHIRWGEIKEEMRYRNRDRQPEGYQIIFSGLVDASALGVPQARKRLIIVGVRRDLVRGSKHLISASARFRSLMRCPVLEKYPLVVMEAFTGKTIPELQDEYERVLREYSDVAEVVDSPRAREWRREVWGRLTFDIVKDYLAANNIKPASRDELEEAFEKHKEVLEEVGYRGIDVKTLNLPDGSTLPPPEPPSVVEKVRMILPSENFEFVVGTRWELRKKGVSQIYRRLHPLKPSYTVVAYGGGGMAMYHYERQRSALTIREKARLQTFPDSFLFPGSRTDAKAAIGEAVPRLWQNASR